MTGAPDTGGGPERSGALGQGPAAPVSGPPGAGGGLEQPGASAAPRRPWYRRPAVLVAGVVALVVVACVLVDLPRSSSPTEQAAGIATMVRTIDADVHPCAYAAATAFSIRHSEVAGQLTSSQLDKVPTLLHDDVLACTLTDQTVVDLGTLTLPQTAAGRDLGAAVKGILNWETEDAVTAMYAIQALHAHPHDAGALGRLAHAERRLSADRAVAERAVRAASHDLGGADIGRTNLPRLPLPS